MMPGALQAKGCLRKNSASGVRLPVRLRVEGDEAVGTVEEIRHVHRDAPKQQQFLCVSLIDVTSKPLREEGRRLNAACRHHPDAAPAEPRVLMDSKFLRRGKEDPTFAHCEGRRQHIGPCHPRCSPASKIQARPVDINALAQAPRQARSQAYSTPPRWPCRRDDRGSRDRATTWISGWALRPPSCSLLSVAANKARAETRISYTLPGAISSLRQRISSSTGGSTITHQLSLRIEYVKEPAFLSPHRIPICAAFKWSTLK
jgi:hypothetical protein